MRQKVSPEVVIRKGPRGIENQCHKREKRREEKRREEKRREEKRREEKRREDQEIRRRLKKRREIRCVVCGCVVLTFPVFFRFPNYQTLN